MRRIIQITVLPVVGFLLAACSMSSPSFYEQSIPPEILLEAHQAAAGDSAAIHALFRRSLHPDSEVTSSEELVQYLDDVGEDRFFAAWKKEPPNVRHAVVLNMMSVLNNNPSLYDLRRKMLAVDGEGTASS